MTDTEKLVQEIGIALLDSFGTMGWFAGSRSGTIARGVVESPSIQALLEKANRAERLEEALRKWPCADCGGTKAIRGVGGLLVECDFCHGTGVHPTARAALLAKEQNQVGDR